MGLIDKIEFKNYKKKADSGDSFYQWLVGSKYENGYVVQQDYEEAYRYYKLSADQGDSRGQFELGRFYENGYGVQQDYEEAYRYYKLSADQENPYGQFAIAKFYENGFFVQQDYEEAYRYYKFAAVIVDALVALGRLYENGYGVPQNYEEAYRYYKLAEDKIAQSLYDHVEDSFTIKDVVYITLGRLYENGYGVPKDYEKACRYYLLVSINPESKVALGKLYENGYGVPQDYEKAAEYYSYYIGVPLSAEAFIRLYESGCIDKSKYVVKYRTAKRVIESCEPKIIESFRTEEVEEKLEVGGCEQVGTEEEELETEKICQQVEPEEVGESEPKQEETPEQIEIQEPNPTETTEKLETIEIVKNKEKKVTEENEVAKGYAFISYSTKNQMAADSVNNLLHETGIKTWMAPYDIPAGSKYAAVITRALKECACLVLILSNDSQSSIWVGNEVERAMDYKKPIIPIQIEDVILNEEFEFYISSTQIVAVQKIDKDSKEIQNVLASVKALTENMV